MTNKKPKDLLIKPSELKRFLKRDMVVKAIDSARKRKLNSPSGDGFSLTFKNPFKTGDRVLIKTLCFAKIGARDPMPNEQVLIGFVESTTDCAVKVLGYWYHASQAQIIGKE